MGAKGSFMEHDKHDNQFQSRVFKDLLSFALDEQPVPYDDERPLYVDAERPNLSLNASQFRFLVQTLIAGLRRRAGIQSGDVVLVTLPNNAFYSAIFFGIIGAGGIYMGVNPSSQYAEMDHFLELSTPKLIITAPSGLSLLQEVTEAKNIPQNRICVLDDYALLHISEMLSSLKSADPKIGLCRLEKNYLYEYFNIEVMNFSALLRYGTEDWIRFEDQARAINTPAAMYTTSGTGGMPKGAILSHHAIITQHQSLYYKTPYDTTRLICIPMFHLFGALFTHLWPIRYGETCYILSRFEIVHFVKTIYLYRITETYMVPAMVQSLTKQSGLELSQFFRSLRYIGTAGASLDPALAELLELSLHPEAQVSQIWGMTEAGVAFQWRYGHRDTTGSIGRLLANYEVKLLDTQGHEIVSDNVPGELYVRGPGILMEYKGTPAAKDEDGWFRTGDIVSVRGGQYYVVGRAKELIKVRGWQVAPAEIEGVLLKHPCIADAAVVGVKNTNIHSTDRLEDELVRAFIVRRKTPAAARLSSDEVYRFARRQLVSYKALTGGVIFVDEIPRTPSGKVQRFKLVEMCAYRDMVSKLLFFKKPPVDSPVWLASVHNLGIKSGKRPADIETHRIELQS